MLSSRQDYIPAVGGRRVIIAPHQDDEAFGCAGLTTLQCDSVTNVCGDKTWDIRIITPKASL